MIVSMKMILTTIGVLLLAYIGLCLLLFIFQKYLIYFPDKNIMFTPRDVGLIYEDIYIETSDAERIHAWYIPSDSVKGVLLFCHGNAGNISHRLESIKIFNALSLDVMIFDYRGFGKSTGSPDEPGTYLDAEAVWEYLVRERGFPPGQIIIFGRSLGSAIAAGLSQKKKPAALILESSFTSIPDLGAKLYPIFPVRLLARYKYSTIKRLQNISCPILFIHSPNDEIIPYSHGQENYQTARKPKQFLEISGSHNDGFLVSGKNYYEGILNFLGEHFF